jgi:CheY-like chemotaxis protein
MWGIYVQRLTQVGLDVITASTRCEALLSAVADAPNVIVVDLDLPAMDGLMATTRLKADHRTAHIPVIGMTAYVFTGETVAADVGCDIFLPKPCHPDRLLYYIVLWGGRSRGG